MITTTALASTLGVARRTIQLSCKRIGLARAGRDYFLTPEQAREVEKDIRGRKAGRPPKETK